VGRNAPRQREVVGVTEVELYITTAGRAERKAALSPGPKASVVLEQ
jgi:hypothetical protein